jgi:CHASE3 domain sensor protein
MTLFDIRTWTLRRRVTALIATVALLLAALGVLAAVTATNSNHHIQTILTKTGPMRAAGESLNTAVVDQETGIRGYAISGQQADLQPYTAGVAAEQRLIEQIDDLLEGGDDDRIRTALTDVQRQSDAWRAAVATPVIDAVQADGPEAGQVLIEAATTARFDALRAAIGDLQQQILVVREASARAAENTGNTLVAIEIAAAAIIVLAGAALVLLLDRLVTRPVVELATQVR